jgi:hypothetical protein
MVSFDVFKNEGLISVIRFRITLQATSPLYESVSHITSIRTVLFASNPVFVMG